MFAEFVHYSKAVKSTINDFVLYRICRKNIILNLKICSKKYSKWSTVYSNKYHFSIVDDFKYYYL